jgi:cbb3-type cytochrome c oxidase subunit III
VSISAAAKAAGITPAMVALGDSVFHGQVANGTCTACHGSDAKGTPLAPDLTDGTWLWSDGSYKAIVSTIKAGVPSPKEHRGVMPPMGGVPLTPAQVSAVGAYVFALSHQQGG